jgi:hypothetical protein
VRRIRSLRQTAPIIRDNDEDATTGCVKGAIQNVQNRQNAFNLRETDRFGQHQVVYVRRARQI